jgi:hypothetical protein
MVGLFACLLYFLPARLIDVWPPGCARIRTTVMTAGMLPGAMFVVMLCLNAISLHYGTINTVPFSMMVTMVFMWLLVSFPMVIVGAIVGRCGPGCTLAITHTCLHCRARTHTLTRTVTHTERLRKRRLTHVRCFHSWTTLRSLATGRPDRLS